MLLDLDGLYSRTRGASSTNFGRRECLIAGEGAVTFESTCSTVTKEPLEDKGRGKKWKRRNTRKIRLFHHIKIFCQTLLWPIQRDTCTVHNNILSQKIIITHVHVYFLVYLSCLTNCTVWSLWHCLIQLMHITPLSF